MSPKKKIVFQSAFETYVANELIGQGGAGYVYKSQDSAGNWCAIKLLNPQNVTNERLKRFKNEVLFCQNHEHPNVIRVVDDGPYLEEGISVPFYVMPLYDSTLRSLMKEGIKADHILLLFAQLLDGVEVAHLKGVVHRDLKPENFLYNADANHIVVADFGIARFQEDELYTAVETKATDRLANFQYAAPEQRKRGAPTDRRTDIYALGLILNEMFTGEVPQGTGYKTIESVAVEYAYLDDLVAGMIRQSPEERFASIDDIKKELIGRKNEFVERQRLSQLKNTVVSTSEIDDPLVVSPIRLTDFDWQNGELTLVLSQSVNNSWINAFRNLGTYSSVSGKGPSAFRLSDNKARINAHSEQEVKLIIGYFQSWLTVVNNAYIEGVKRQKVEDESRSRRELQAKIEAEEARQRLKKSIKL